jgi:hypothetical protein
LEREVSCIDGHGCVFASATAFDFFTTAYPSGIVFLKLGLFPSIYQLR